MENFTVKLEGEFVESVEANNEEEARQLVMRLTNLTIGSGGPCFTITNTTICHSPKQEKEEGERE